MAIDPDNPERTEADFAAARPARDVLPPALYDRLVSDRTRAATDPVPAHEPRPSDLGVREGLEQDELARNIPS